MVKKYPLTVMEKLKLGRVVLHINVVLDKSGFKMGVMKK